MWWWEGERTEVRSESSSLFWSVEGEGVWAAAGMDRRLVGRSSVKGSPNLLDVSC